MAWRCATRNEAFNQGEEEQVPTVEGYVKSRENDLRREWLEEAMKDWPCNCPEPTKPTHIVETEPGWFVGYYVCLGCGERWKCGWSMRQLNRQMQGADLQHPSFWKRPFGVIS